MNLITRPENLVDQLPMQALAMGSELAFPVSESLSRGKVVFAVFPFQALLPMFFDAALLVIVLRVVGATLTIKLALQTSFCACVGCEFLAQGSKPCLPCAWDNGQRRGSQIQADHVGSWLVLGFLVGRALYD